MAADANDPGAPVRWLAGHWPLVIWMVALAAGVLNSLAKTLRTAARRSTAGAASAANVPVRAAPPSAFIRPPAGVAATAAAVPVAAPQPARASRPAIEEPAALHGAGTALLAAFRDPEGARTAVVLAEILGAPVALRSRTRGPGNAL